MSGLMDGWMTGRIVRQMDGGVNLWMGVWLGSGWSLNGCGWVDAWMCGGEYRSVGGWIGGWMNRGVIVCWACVV